MKTVSCGIIVLNPSEELLLCHATGTPYWDIPKGGADAGETERQAAVREATEETGMAFDPAELLELGRFTYRPGKDLHLFAVLVERMPTGNLICRTHFQDRHGHLLPEMDAFAWTPFTQVPARCAPRMTTVLTRSLDLPQLLASLVA